ncbi:conserved hypothetical protein [Desulforapulum autotrophicum HRM2]|uniref:DUF3783 domain-containing protein n=1 Tax=Desulforapulum autotrophicum (strain ATCC 43914 / DSM 3382 / VKM B-1955 / HRM2) TaxID=177437 RepID=C0QHE3_DESAH|nr:DUF3783 domain-containing protein [Desulforapulum autotrophicum]ACN17802.1 conserved hypothetical protein [Desulforapulum autotrophicum HRM2]
MADGTFEKVTHSDRPFYGARKLLICGFSSKAQVKFKNLLQMVNITDLPIVWATSGEDETCLSDLFAQPDNTGSGVSSTLPRAIVLSGITNNELHRLMDMARKTGMKPVLWAVLTPTSETWTLKSLLGELAAERRAMQQKK